MGKSLKRGESLDQESDSGTLWRLEQGVVLLQRATADGIPLTQIALPGDLIGLEKLCSQHGASSAIALVECKLSQLDLSGDYNAFAAFMEGYMQQQQRMHDMLRLRTGPVASRLEHLVHMLANSKHDQFKKLNRRDLPPLREMAQIMDATVETISRALKFLFPPAARATMNEAPASHDSVLAA
jgi:hypothetical protein